ncbi:MAG: hypothetical protein BACB_02157 [Bacteroides thetaiotaomicron]
MMEHGRDASQKAELRERIIMTATEAFTLKRYQVYYDG